jgi:preprotein translocase subunit SecD
MLRYLRRDAVDTKGHLWAASTWFLLVLLFLSTQVRAEQISLNSSKADAEIYELNHAPVVFVELTVESGIKYAKFTSTHVGDMCIFKVEGEEIMTLKILTPMLDGHIILGDFRDMRRAEQVAELLRAGALIKVSNLNNR